MTNKIVVVFDEDRLARRKLTEQIIEIAKKAGLDGRIMFVR